MTKKLFILVIFLLVSILNMASLWNYAFAQSVDTAWVRRYNGTGNGDDVAHDIAVDDSGNIYVTGISYGNGTFFDYATIKYYLNGDTAWVRRYNGPGDSTDWATAIAIDDSGNVYITGYSYGSETYDDYATIKYDSNGNVLWVRRYNGPGDSTDGASGLVVDRAGNIYVTGYSCGSEIDFGYCDYVTIKYYPNGDTAWVRRYEESGYRYDIAHAIAIDDSGNVYVTGESWSNSVACWDYATIKYYPNGETAWVRIYNGPAIYNHATDIALDGSGNVYVTGGSYGSGTYDDYTTIKYDSSGNELWVRRYNGSRNDHDVPYAMAVDGSANVYVTGEINGLGIDADYATIKYDSSGNEVWVRRYNSVNYYDVAYDIALDGME